MLKRVVAAAIVAVMSASAALAEEIRITCTLTEMWDDSSAEMEAAEGSDAFVISSQADGSTTYRLPFVCVDETLVAEVSDTEIEFRCNQQIGRFVADVSATINRVSGEYVRRFAGKGNAGGIYTFGVCD